MRQELGEARVDGPKPPLEITVEESGSASAFLFLRQEWNALVERSGARLFDRHECIRAWLVSFAPAARLVVLTARDRAGRLVAVLPLVAETGLLAPGRARKGRSA